MRPSRLQFLIFALALLLSASFANAEGLLVICEKGTRGRVLGVLKKDNRYEPIDKLHFAEDSYRFAIHVGSDEVELRTPDGSGKGVKLSADNEKITILYSDHQSVQLFTIFSTTRMLLVSIHGSFDRVIGTATGGGIATGLCELKAIR